MEKRALIVIFFVVVLTAGATSVFVETLRQGFIAPPQEPEVPEIQVTQKRIVYPSTASSTLPVRLIIPSLGVNATVQKVGISRRKTMAVPTNYTDVGWYKYGAIPGQRGSAVIAGHLDNGFGLPGVFKRLTNLRPGDEVIVEDAQGMKLYFTVTHTSTVAAKTVDTAAIFGSFESANLNLITCEGAWDAHSQTYSLRRVVFTTFSRAESPWDPS